MKNAFFGMKTFYDFLRRTKDYMESDAAIKRLAWKPGISPVDDVTDRARGVWVQLEEPKDRPNEPESTFRAFMDENVREVFDLIGDESDDPGERHRNGRRNFADERKLTVLDRDTGTSQLLLDKRPEGAQLLLRPNTVTLHRQIQALQALQNAPSSFHLPLLRLMESEDHARWPFFEAAEIDDGWMVLTDVERPGTDQQRRFVEIAMATPDFVFLEGPPGSGKTTAICELVLQLANKGKRVLLCASTHVAVDNVLERLMDERNPHKDLVIPVRIGERRNVSEKAGPWQLERFVKTERERLLGHLEGRRDLSESQRALLDTIRHGSTTIERMVLDAANLVCGTTIGILQHPDIKANGQTTAAFDVLIVDEASKTTFQEFLVPALLAKRWVIVGDPKQLSPYVDDAAMAVNVEACLSDETIRNACIDVFMAGHGDSRRRRIAAVSIDGTRAIDVYTAQAAARDVNLANASSDDGLWGAAVVVGTLADLERRVDELPLDIATVRHSGEGLHAIRRRAEAWLRLSRRAGEEPPEWASEVAWRFARLYEQRFVQDVEHTERGTRSTARRLREQITDLLPVAETGMDAEWVWSEIDRVRRVALPSILESLRHGFERDPTTRKGTALSDGLPAPVLKARHVLLSMQHRMHPEIAAFSHEHIYDCEALYTPNYISAERAWEFKRHAHRAVWLDVRGEFNSRSNSNPCEARAVIDELQAFDEWANRNPRNDGRPWEAAVLTFYRGQEREIRTHLRRWAQQPSGMRHFCRGIKDRPYFTVELCTVDRFQGHEADLVMLSFASARPTSFLESPNRLNVALTRARYQRIVIGDRHAMTRAKASVLGVFAENEKWETTLKRSAP